MCATHYWLYQCSREEEPSYWSVLKLNTRSIQWYLIFLIRGLLLHFDLKWGYHHLDVLPGLPMGYMCVTAILYLFWLRLPVMCLQSLWGHWCTGGDQQGLRQMSTYIDDGICSANSIQAYVLECEAVASDLKNATGSPSKLESRAHLVKSPVF